MAKRKKKKSVSPWLIVLLVVVLIVLALLAAAYFGLRYFYSRSNSVADEDVTINYALLTQGDASDESLEGFTQPETLNEEDAKLLSDSVQKVSNVNIIGDSSVYNILLIGADSRNKAWYGNSDAMILVSVNSETNKIFMTSFMRDLYAVIPDIGGRKLNSAYAIGGGPLLVRTIEENYRIDINNYASVDFDSTADIIDLLGGVDMEMSADEVKYANDYITELCELRGLDPNGYYISQPGYHHLNGIQTVGFARIRYVKHGNENYDYGRTLRQREILTQLMTNARGLTIPELTAVVNDILPLVTHNIDPSTLLSLISNAASYINYEIVTERIPYDGMFYSSNENLIPDFEQTINRLHSTIYAN